MKYDATNATLIEAIVSLAKQVQCDWSDTNNATRPEIESNQSDSNCWLNKNMFDFRGLIPKGLALSTEIYNPYVED